MIRELYSVKANRDRRAAQLKAEGFKVVRRSTGPQRLHPEYIRDWPYTYETGFGNTDYQTMHKNLYVLEAV